MWRSGLCLRLCRILKAVGKGYGHGRQCRARGCRGRSAQRKSSKEPGTPSKPQRLSAPTEKKQQQTPCRRLSGRQMFLPRVWQPPSTQVLAGRWVKRNRLSESRRCSQCLVRLEWSRALWRCEFHLGTYGNNTLSMHIHTWTHTHHLPEQTPSEELPWTDR